MYMLENKVKPSLTWGGYSPKTLLCDESRERAINKQDETDRKVQDEIVRLTPLWEYQKK